MQIIANIILSLSLLLILSLTSLINYSVLKFISLAQAVLILFGAYLLLFFQVLFGATLLLSILLSIICCIVFGLLGDILIFRAMRRKRMPALSFLIVSVGLYIIFQNIISLFFGDDSKYIYGGKVSVGHQIFGGYVTTIQIITICLSFAIFIIVNLIFHFTKTGKSIRAVSNNPELCNIYGISSNKIILIAIAIGSVLAAVAGILSAMDTNMTPTFGFNLLLYGVVADYSGAYCTARSGVNCTTHSGL